MWHVPQNFPAGTGERKLPCGAQSGYRLSRAAAAYSQQTKAVYYSENHKQGTWSQSALIYQLSLQVRIRSRDLTTPDPNCKVVISKGSTHPPPKDPLKMT